MKPIHQFKIFIVEDNPLIAEQEKILLQNWGHGIAGWTTNTPAALDFLRKNSPPDLILINVELAGQSDGLDLARLVRTRWRLPVVVVSGFLKKNLSAKLLLMPEVHFLSKPFLPFQLKNTISIALEAV